VEDVIINIRGYEVIISACDAERVKAHRWYKSCIKGSPYFAFKRNYKHVTLHRFITDCPIDMFVDHINGNTLDNRRSNLRICTRRENNRNRCRSKNSTSGYKGVFWNKHKLKWTSYIRTDEKRVCLGYFDTPEKAYEAYVAASKKYHGEFGRIA
jgi:hypothetical protein